MHKDLGPINITTKSKLKTKKLKRWKKSTYNKKVSQSYRGKYNSVWSLWQQNLKVIIGQVSSNRIIHLNQTRKIVWGIRGNKGDAVIAHAKEIVAQCKWKVVERNGGTIRWCRDVKISKLVWLKWGTKSAECLAGRLQPWRSSGLPCWEPWVSGQWIWNFIWKLLKVIQIEFIWGGIICCHGWKGVAGGGSRDAKERLLFFGPLWPPSGWGGGCAYRVCLMLLCIISVTLGSWILPWGCWQGWCWLQYRLQWPLHPTLGFGVFLRSPQFLGSQSFFLVWAPWPPQRWKCHVNSFGNTFSN